MPKAKERTPKHEIEVFESAAESRKANKNKDARLYSFILDPEKMKAAAEKADKTLYVTAPNHGIAFRTLCKKRFGIDIFLGEPKVDTLERVQSVLDRYAASKDPAVKQLIQELQMARAGEEVEGVAEQAPPKPEPSEPPPPSDPAPAPPADPPPAPPAG
jgi:hypothetical protein